MADALVSVVLEQLGTIMEREVAQKVRLVVGVSKEVQKLKATLQTISAVLVDAEKRQVKEESVKLWLDRLDAITYEMDDVLDEWSTTIIQRQINEEAEKGPIRNKKVPFYIPSSTCFCFGRVILRRHDIAAKIKDISEKLDVIASEKDKFKFDSIRGPEELDRPKTTSLIDTSEVYGREWDKDTVIGKLCESSSQEESSGLTHVISIIGMGGMGKTTLSQLAYNDDVVKAHFDTRVWVCVSDPFDEVRVAKAIVEALEGNAPNIFELETLIQRIKSSIKGKKFLLVLDDVWTEDDKKWEPIKLSLKGALLSRVLVTTRSERVATVMGTTYTHRLGELSDKACWSLFSQISFFGRSETDCQELEPVGRKIVDKCKGLPLAAKTLGGLLRFKNTVQDWENVLCSDIWEFEVGERDLFRPLLLSYYDLPSAMKKCFSYCAVFLKDVEIDAKSLINLWMSQGYLQTSKNIDMEIVGQDYLENLAMRSFFQDLEKDDYGDGHIVRCKMHDIVHDFVQFLTKNKCIVMEVDDNRIKRRMEASDANRHHLTLIGVKATGCPISIGKAAKLRTLSFAGSTSKKLVVEKKRAGILARIRAHAQAIRAAYLFKLAAEQEHESHPVVLAPDLFHGVTCLRALNLCDTGLAEVPSGVEKLIHLRYLDISNNSELRELPETVCDLCNLQTLLLNYCDSLVKLPRGIGKLINLRHIEIENTPELKRLPKGIGRLSSLRTLTNFPVPSKGGISEGESEEEACQLGDLKNLKNLGHSLQITGLNRVADAGDAEKAELKNRKHLLHLELMFDPEDGPGKGRMDVLEALQPHPNLQRLTISGYGGTEFPNWMISLTKLKRLDLKYWENCVCLPRVLGDLPSLEILKIVGMGSLKCVGLEFLGMRVIDKEGEDDHGTPKNDGRMRASSASPSAIAFPKLKELSFHAMREWQDWDDSHDTTGKMEAITIMPCLRWLELVECPKLKTLPHRLLQAAPSLVELDIYHSRILKQRYTERSGESFTKISHIPSVIIE